jgi:hypothetical protein
VAAGARIGNRSSIRVIGAIEITSNVQTAWAKAREASHVSRATERGAFAHAPHRLDMHPRSAVVVRSAISTKFEAAADGSVPICRCVQGLMPRSSVRLYPPVGPSSIMQLCLRLL